MAYDERWDDIAVEWLIDAGLPARLVTRYSARLAQVLHDHAEQFVEVDIPEEEQQRDEAARDAHINRQIDEARGK